MRGLLAVICGALMSPAMIPLAASADAGYQLTVSESSTTMTYGELSPSFRAYLTPPSGEAPNINTFYLSVDSSTYAGSISISGSQWILYVGGIVPSPPPGLHNVVAKYLSQSKGLLVSAPVSFTVLKSTPTLDCGVITNANTYSPNATLTFRPEFANTNAPVDSQNGTFSVRFVGARTFSLGPLTTDSAGQITVHVPSVTGIYQARCAFSGTSLFNPAEAGLSVPTVIVSANNAVGGIALYTNPTPVRSNVMTSWLVVVSARQGLPAPTGNVSLRIDRSYTQVVPLEAGGRVTIQAVAPAVWPSSAIQVDYDGDPVYAASHADFSLNTPPMSAAAVPTASHAGSTTAAVIATPTPAPAATASSSVSSPAVALASPRLQVEPNVPASAHLTRSGELPF